MQHYTQNTFPSAANACAPMPEWLLSPGNLQRCILVPDLTWTHLIKAGVVQVHVHSVAAVHSLDEERVVTEESGVSKTF